MTSGMLKWHRNLWIVLLIAIPILMFLALRGLSFDTKASKKDATNNVQSALTKTTDVHGT